MKKLTRRSVLKSMGKMSVLAAAAPLMPAIVGCRSDRQILLNVALHGLFVLNICDDKRIIQLLTPEIHEHIYKVGGWDKDEICDINPGSTYTLNGAKAESAMPFFDWNQTPIFFHSQDRFSLDYSKKHFQLNLPFPASLKLLRCATKDDCAPGSYPETIQCDSKMDKYTTKYIDNVSLCQVLTYKVPDYRELGFLADPQSSPLPWKTSINWETRTANLHLWAEPPKRLTSHHANEAYSKLSCMLPPFNLHLRVYSTAPLDRDTGICGFPPEQELGWSDWVSGGGEGVHPTNCCAVFIRS